MPQFRISPSMILIAVLGIGFSFLSPRYTAAQQLSVEQQDRLEALAQQRFDEQDATAAAKIYLELARTAQAPAQRGRYGLLSAWILHQDQDHVGRDDALRVALTQDPLLQPNPDAYAADFVSRVQAIKVELETDRVRRTGQLTTAAQQALDRGDVDAAIRSYQEVLRIDPQRYPVRLKLAVEQLNAGQAQGAITTLKPMIERLEFMDGEIQERVNALMTLARIRTGDLTGVEPTIQRTSGDVQKQLWLELGAAHRSKGDVDRAIAAYGSALEIDPADRHTAILRAQLMTQSNRVMEAESFLIDLSETLPQAAEVWSELGKVREEIGDEPGAMAAYRRAVDTRPAEQADKEGRIEALTALARLHRTSDPELANDYLEQALESAPSNVDALAVKARLLSDQGAHASAIDFAQAAQRGAPDRFDLQNLLGNSLYLAGHYEQAASVFEQILKENPEIEAVRENLELARSMIGSPPQPSRGPAVSATPASSSEAVSSSKAGGAREPVDGASSVGRNAATGAQASSPPQPDPSALPVGLSVTPYVWPQTGRKVLRVDAVASGSKAERCGVVLGDLLIRIESRSVNSANQVNTMMKGNTNGFRLDIVRDDVPRALVCI